MAAYLRVFAGLVFAPLIFVWIYKGKYFLIKDSTPLRVYDSFTTKNRTVRENTSRQFGVTPPTTSSACDNGHPVKHFVFTKVEKTGSSTTKYMLNRFVKTHELNAMTQTSGNFLSWKTPRAEYPGWDIGPAAVDRADAVTGHAIYNKTMMDMYMVKEYKFIGIAREPVSWYRSWVRFLLKIPEFRQQNSELCTRRVKTNRAEDILLRDNQSFYIKRQGISGLKTWFHLNQLQWLGFDYNQRNNMVAIKEYISWVVKQMDIIILTDVYDASLVVMRRRFCWNYTDIFYKKYKVQKPAEVQLSATAIDRLLSPEFNLGDKLLYDEMNATWWKQPELKENDFWKEVAHFRALNADILDMCQIVKFTKKDHKIPASQWHENIYLTKDFCSLFPKQISLPKYALGKRYVKILHKAKPAQNFVSNELSAVHSN